MSEAPFVIRTFEPPDAKDVCEIFYRSVHEVALAKYAKAQLDAWAPRIPDSTKWLAALSAFHTYVAADERGKIVAWIAMRPDGYIDMLFCLAEAVGRGAAAMLYDTIEKIARSLGLPKMTAHASLLAEPFFAKRGWKVEKHEPHIRNGIDIPRAEMSKDLSATR